MFLVLQWAQGSARASLSAWHWVTALFILPFIVLAPINGALSNSISRRWILFAASAGCLAAFLILGTTGGPWVALLICVSLGSALYSPARYALLPAAARETGLPLARITSWIELGGAGGIIGGLTLAYVYFGKELGDTPWFWSRFFAFWAPGSWPAAIGMGAAFSLLAWVTALFAKFPSDTSRPESGQIAIRGFFNDLHRVFADQECRSSLLGLSAVLALMAAGSGILLTIGIEARGDGEGLVRPLMLLIVGTAMGSWTAGLQTHRMRGLGLVAFAGIGLVVGLAWAILANNFEGPGLVLGFMGGLANVPLRSYYLSVVPDDAKGNATALMNLSIHAISASLALAIAILTWIGLLATPGRQLAVLILLTIICSLAAWRILLRSLMEQALEVIVAPIYRIKGYGPGLITFPLKGPVLIVANHSAWFDPLWLGKVVPRFLTPMMTSVYYDKPVMRWLMEKVVGTIRVPSRVFRREAPELQDAVKALNENRVLLIFPEGALRKKEEQLIRYFGQGVCRILQARPATPVVACWIEGGWGSYASYLNGPPTVNKRLDRWRSIKIGMAPPQVIDREILEDTKRTRLYLMQACLDARQYLGLSPERAEDFRLDETLSEKENGNGNGDLQEAART